MLAFDRSEKGTVTAANASSLNDGACAMILMTEEDAKQKGIQPLARIRGFGDAAQNPVDFTTTPSLAVPVALKQAGMDLTDVEYHEINEAFSVVALANMKLMSCETMLECYYCSFRTTYEAGSVSNIWSTMSSTDEPARSMDCVTEGYPET